MPTHLDPSALGTKAYWDSAYTLELANHASSARDEGTIWFSDAAAEERILQYLDDLASGGQLMQNRGEGEGDDNNDDNDDDDDDEEEDAGDGGEAVKAAALTTFLDLGTGNGHLLFALRDEGWEGVMMGVDYSGKSVALARQIAAARQTEEKGLDVRFEEFDILAPLPASAPDWLGDGFDVVLDKGTFDAISLSGETDARGRRICEGYRERVERLVKKGGRLVITSCNWTSEELKGWFGGGELVYEDAIRYPSFTFGGQTGQQVCTLCFRRDGGGEP
ncbi:S-adenosyl-L-methionine-dependent methyltransferase [Saccharata proteae CBS 121410]|uniref:Protein-lysine N-methyltransferase EFM4 n=1 Tax=Saccharata proteae CBS 121410 TaxID=1314787 RepID=A0A9P4I217_9PEZI|nr:S-adenosyl-L-methionine-dependent methyltransferase [Saccharata proteae CBS 121410]